LFKKTDQGTAATVLQDDLIADLVSLERYSSEWFQKNPALSRCHLTASNVPSQAARLLRSLCTVATMLSAVSTIC